jgi:hypothetical protein
MNLGGPVWHASVSYSGRFKIPEVVRMDRCRHVLAGVGDARLGEWVEVGNHGVLHLRRRLSDAECAEFGLSVRNIRRTHEARERYDLLPRQVKQLVPAFVYLDEIGAP